jgi:hypothetical protein
MKWLGIILMAALLAMAPGYCNAQQQAEQGKIAPGQPTEEGKFPTGQPSQEGKFPTEAPAKSGKSPAIQPQGQQGKAEQAQPLKNYSPKEKKAYLKETDKELATIEKRIDALKVKKEFNTVQRKRSNLMVMVALKKKLLIARNQFSALEKAPETGWSAQKQNVDQTMADLKKSFSDSMEIFE